MRRRFALALASLLSVGILAVPAAHVRAQAQAVRLTLLEQTPDWNDPKHPTTTVRFRAQNTGDETFGDLSIGVTLWSPARSRTAFEEAMRTDVPGAVRLCCEPDAREGTLAPGQSRDFTVSVDLPIAQLSSTESLVYPLTIDLRSQYRSLAAIRTPVIYLVRTPQMPLAFSWTFVLHAQLTLGPDGVFRSPALETAISRGGRLAGQIAAISDVAKSGVGVDVAVSPLLLYQLEHMRDGYRVIDGGGVRAVPGGEGGSAAAQQALATLREIAHAPNVELSALPYAEPLLPALTSGGLSLDLGVQMRRGRDVVSALLGKTPSTSVLRPPQSAIDGTSLDELPALGVSTLLLDPSSVRRAEDAQGFAPSPLVSLAGENGPVTGVVGDPAIQTMLASGAAEADPVLASRTVLGDLAEIWLQRPSEPRALAMTLGEGIAAPGAFYRPLARAIAGAPWLAKRTTSGLLQDPGVEQPTGVTDLIASPSSFSTAYATSIKRARRLVETLRTMLVRPSGRPAHLQQLLLLAESQRFVGDETSGTAFVDRVRRSTMSTFRAVQPEVGQPVTLTSSAIRDVPIPIRNEASVPLRATIRLSSPHLVEPVARTRVLPAGSTSTVGMDLRLKTTGWFEVSVDILAPTGRRIGHTTLKVRSTAYNRVALFITIGAAALAMLVWARRFVPRRST